MSKPSPETSFEAIARIVIGIRQPIYFSYGGQVRGFSIDRDVYLLVPEAIKNSYLESPRYSAIEDWIHGTVSRILNDWW
ncbi:MAG: hypothetical protein K2X81_24745, partial [Candidatus Obscuribacterales bacterium]|nr:hypothetical protein [Candidatus Obscuribacterales bacterium]